MAQLPEDRQEGGALLSDRINTYCTEVQTLIKQGVEAPRFEFKRACSISKDHVDDRLDFIKFLQGVANAEIEGERCIIIGADPSEKMFYPVSNAAEFDPAPLSAIVDKYLYPAPRFQVFNNLQTEDGQPFVLIVLDASQPRPIVVTTEGRRTDGKTRLQKGDIWIKRNTALQLATRDDLDRMYKLRMETESEERTRQRVKHLTDLSRSSSVFGIPRPSLPDWELVIGPVAGFERFVNEVIVGNDKARFRMLLELAEDPLRDGWHSLDARVRGSSGTIQEYVAQASGFFKDEFLPSLQSLVSIGLLIVKHDFHTEWLESVIESLIEAFDGCRSLQALKSGYVAPDQDPLPWWRPAYEVYMAVKCIATYAVLRKRHKFLGVILPKMVARISIDDRKTLRTPILFWPFDTRPFPDGQLNEGRSTFSWKERISASWGRHFASYDKFLDAACQLEFLLELNSYLGTNSVKDAKIADWLESNGRELSFIYSPDLFIYELYRTTPMAELCYDFIASTDSFPRHLAVEPALFDLLLKGKGREDKLLMYGGFLHDLRVWQEKTMWHGFHRMPFMDYWEGRLKDVAKSYKEQPAV